MLWGYLPRSYQRYREIEDAVREADRVSVRKADRVSVRKADRG